MMEAKGVQGCHLLTHAQAQVLFYEAHVQQPRTEARQNEQSSVANKELKASATWYATEPRAWTPT